MSWTVALAAALLAAAGSAGAQGGNRGGYDGARIDSGRAFALMFLQNLVDMPPNRPVELHVANSGSGDALVTVSLPLYSSDSCQREYKAVVKASGTVRIVICPDVRHSHVDGSIANKAVVVTSDRDVSLVGYNSEMYSADAFSVLPVQSLRQIYLTTTYSPTNIATQFGIVAAQDTTVSIYIKPKQSTCSGGETSFDYKGVVYKNGDFVRFVLPGNQTFLAYSVGDLSGVVVWTDQPAAVFSGNARTYVDYTQSSRDHIVEQAVPASQLGRSFAFQPTPRAHTCDMVRIVARLHNTTVHVYSSGDPYTILLDAGDVYEGNYTKVTHFASDKPVSISVIVRSQEGPEVAATDPTDPSLYFLQPLELYAVGPRLTPTFVFSADDGPFDISYVLISIADGQKNGVLLDGRPVAGWSKPASSPLQIVSAAASIDPNKTHSVSHVDATVAFSVLLYSASDRESAATVLGLSYQSPCIETGQIPGDGVDNDCDGLVDEENCANRIDDDLDILVNEDCFKKNPLELSEAYELVFLSNDVFDPENPSVDQLELFVAASGNKSFNVTITSPKYFNSGTGLPVVNYVDLTINVDDTAFTTGSLANVTIPTNLRLNNEDEFGISTWTQKGIRVQSTNGERFFLYGINKRSYSTDSFLAYPMAAADNGQQFKVYYTISSDIYGNSYDRTLIGIVAHEDNTDVWVDIRDSVNLLMDDGSTYTGPARLNLTGMQSHDSWQLQSEQDLTGTRLTTTKYISVFSGNSRTRIPKSGNSRDHLVEQIPLVDFLNFSYSSLSSPRDDGVGDQWKVVATQPNTIVRYNYYALDARAPEQSGSTTLAKAGDFCLIDPAYQVAINIEADDGKPILVGQLVKSRTIQITNTDPSLIFLPPPEQWTDNYWLATPLSGSLDKNGVELPYNNTLLFVTDGDTKASIIINTQAAGVERSSGDFTWYGIPGKLNLFAARVAITHGHHHVLSNNGGNFMLIMFGAQNRESYANVAGLKFQLPESTCSRSAMSIVDGIDNDCDQRIDEELYDFLDNDNDGLVDEDCYETPAFTKTYYVIYQEHVVDYPKMYPLEMQIGANNPAGGIVCRVSNPEDAQPRYDTYVAIPQYQVQRFGFSPALRVLGSGTVWPNSFKVECSAEADVFVLNKDTSSADGYVSFSADTLGTEYYVMTYEPETLDAQYAVVATQPGQTTVNITLPNGAYISVELSENEVYQGQGRKLTGAHIVADKIVAAYSGNVRTSVNSSMSRDHLAVQLTPVKKWGSSFNLVPTAGHSAADVYQIISAGPASLKLCCQSYSNQFDVALGAVKQFFGKEACHLSSSSPVLVARISQTNGDVSTSQPSGDPSMILLVPESQYGKSATIATPTSSGGYTTMSADYTTYLTVILSGKQDGLLFNGQRPTPEHAWAPINCSAYVYASFNLPGGHSTLHFSHTDPTVSITAIIDGNAVKESYSATVAQTLPTN